MLENKILLEITVDKTNEKGAGAFEQVLTIIHKTLEKKPTYYQKKFKRYNYNRPEFSFEIAKIGSKIRFFLAVEKKYKEFLVNQIYAHYNNIEIQEVKDYLEDIPEDKITVGKVGLEKHNLYPIKNYTNFSDITVKEAIDPFSAISSSLSKVGDKSISIFQVGFSPIWDSDWKAGAEETISIITSKKPKWLKKILLDGRYKYLLWLLYPFNIIGKLLGVFSSGGDEGGGDEGGDDDKKDKKTEDKNKEADDRDIPSFFKDKLAYNGYGVSLNIINASDDYMSSRMTVKEIASTLGIYSVTGQNGFRLKYVGKPDYDIIGREGEDRFVLNTQELSGLVHMPTTYVKTPSINWIASKKFEPPHNIPLIEEDKGGVLNPLGRTNFRGTNIEFGIGPNDRRRHMYIIGKTGMGKSTLLENMIVDDIEKGRGVAVVDPHGDLAENIMGLIPKSRTNNVIIFDPADTSYPIAFNMLDNVKEEHRPLIASGLVGIFKKIFGDSWGPRLEHILRNIVLALLEYPGSTFISIPLMLTSEVFRNKVVERITDPIVKKFWTSEFESMSPVQRVEAAGPILNKVGQFLSSSIMRNVLGQSKNTFSLRWAMDNKKIVIINLSKGKMGEDASSLLGAMMITKFQIDAMSRADIPESEREDFYLYVDEFQNFATSSFATILSEARKYKLNLVMANQYIDQMNEDVKGAVFGNVGSIVAFQVGHADAGVLKEAFAEEVTLGDLTNLKKYTIYTKLLIDGMPSPVFSADTLPPPHVDKEVFQSRYEKIQKVSREKYGKPKDLVQKKIYEYISDIEEKEQELKKKQMEYKNREKEQKAKEQERKMAERNKAMMDAISKAKG